MTAQKSQCDVITRKTRTGEAHSPCEVFAADARVAAQRIADGINIASRDTLADISERVGKGDLHSNEAIERDLCDLGVLDGHAVYRRILLANRAIHIFKGIAGAGIKLPDEIQIGVEEIPDDRAQSNELRTVAKTEVWPALFPGGLLEDRKQSVSGRPRQHGASQNNDMIPFLLGQSLPNAFEGIFGVLQFESPPAITWGRHNNKANVRCLDRLDGVRGRPEALAVCLNKGIEAGFLHRSAAVVQGIDRRLGDVNSSDLEPA